MPSAGFPPRRVLSPVVVLAGHPPANGHKQRSTLNLLPKANFSRDRQRCQLYKTVKGVWRFDRFTNASRRRFHYSVLG
jgi:hypothetical protein